MDEISEADDVLLPDAKVRERYGGKSAMWIWRRERDGSGFPRAVWLGRRKHRWLSQLLAWEKRLVVGGRQAAEVTTDENAAAPQ